MVFGDSHLAGDELEQQLIPSANSKLTSVEPWVKFRTDGRIDTLKFGSTGSHAERTTISNFIYDQLATLCPNEDIRTVIKNYNTSTGVGGYLSDKLKAECINYAAPGGTNIGIATAMMLHSSEMDENTLVIMNITNMDRATKFECDLGIGTGVKSVIPLLHAESSDYRHYVELSYAYNDDTMSKYVMLHGLLRSARSIVEERNAALVIIAPEPMAIASRYVFKSIQGDFIDGEQITLETYKHSELFSQIQSYITANTVPASFKDSEDEILKTGAPSRSWFGHWNGNTQEHYVNNYLIPYLTLTGLK